MIDIGPQPWTKTTRKIVFTLSFLTPFLYLCASMKGVTHGFTATNRRYMLLIVGLILGVNGVALTFAMVRGLLYRHLLIPLVPYIRRTLI